MMTELLERKVLIGVAVGFVVGLLIGWLAIGWWLWPVSWTDADPYDLRESHKKTWISMVADSMALNQDVELARSRLAGWPPDELEATMKELVRVYQAEGRAADARNIQALAATLPLPQAPAPTPTAQGGWGWIQICGLLLFLGLIGVAAVLAYTAMRRRRQERPPVEAEPVPKPLKTVPSAWKPAAAPALQTFTATYHLGDEGFDQSFSIESSSGEFLGECGIGVSEVIAPGSPEKVAAFEVWLFDKSDIRTVTKVLASQHAFSDPGLRSRLDPKGEVILATPHQSMLLETASLRVQVEISEMGYGQDPALPAQSFFSNLTSEFRVLSKEPALESRELPF